MLGHVPLVLITECSCGMAFPLFTAITLCWTIDVIRCVSLILWLSCFIKLSAKSQKGMESLSQIFKSFCNFLIFFFYLGFLLQTFTNHCHFHPHHRHVGISQAITAESSPLAHRQRPGSNREPLVSECKLLTTNLHALSLKLVGSLSLLVPDFF